MKKSDLKTVFNDIFLERQYQIKKHGLGTTQKVYFNDPVLMNRKGSCTPERLCEEYEIPTEDRAKFMCNEAFKKGEQSFPVILIEELSEAVSCKDDLVKMRKEVLQVAAVAVAWIEALDKKLNN